MVELAERFVKDHETYLLTSSYDYEVPNLIVHKKSMIRKPFWLKILYNAHYNTKYSRIIKKNFGINIVHSQSTESFECDVVTMQSCHKAWVKQHDSEKGRPFSINPPDYVRKIIERYVLERGSKKIIAISNRVKQEILENYGVPTEKVEVIHSGVNLEEFKPNFAKREKIRTKLGINENQIVLMFSGHEFSRKGLKYIIETLPRIKGNVKLLVAGGDNPTPYFRLASELGMQDHILFLGTLKEDLNDHYAASDLFVFPTLYEPFGLVITEAMASGLPVITSKIAGAAEIMTDGEDGLLLDDPTNSEELAEKINILVEDENLRKQMGFNARKTAEKYSWGYVAQKTLEVFEEILRR
ncbi:MAG: glycosyltransferase family 4 protein [Methanomicrobia archaeon]|nr:glycosyltransferase family 4 protein [Methanomicrobia archaeon]